MADRPLSPHLSIWKWGPAMLVSILHRVSGDGMALVGLSWAFFNHFCSGIRHFVLDIGAGYEVEPNNRWSVVTTTAGVVLTVAFWAAILL